MIEKIPGLPEHVLGFSAKGAVTAKDYETVVIPAVQAQFARRSKGQIRVFRDRELEEAKRWIGE